MCQSFMDHHPCGCINITTSHCATCPIEDQITNCPCSRHPPQSKDVDFDCQHCGQPASCGNPASEGATPRSSPSPSQSRSGGTAYSESTNQMSAIPTSGRPRRSSPTISNRVRIPSGMGDCEVRVGGGRWMVGQETPCEAHIGFAPNSFACRTFEASRAIDVPGPAHRGFDAGSCSRRSCVVCRSLTNLFVESTFHCDEKKVDGRLRGEEGLKERKP